MEGKLTAVVGPMFAGKTLEAIRIFDVKTRARKKVKAFKSILDNRYSETEIVSHTGAKIPAKPISTVLEIYESFLDEPFDVAIIDEAQFLPENSYQDILNHLVRNEVDVYAIGLNTDFRGEPFPTMAKIMAVADDIIRLKGVCAVCGSEEGIMTQRLVNGKPAKYNDPVIVIGADESYECRCRDCHEVKF